MTNDQRKQSDLPEFDLGRFTPYRVALAAQLLSEKLSSNYRKRFGITIPEWRVLVHLVHRDGVSVRDIENAVAMEKSKVSRTATRLEARGLIAKRTDRVDKRLVQLSLTGKGRDLMSGLLPVAQGFQDGVVSSLGTEFEAFSETLEKLIAAYSGGQDQGSEPQ